MEWRFLPRHPKSTISRFAITGMVVYMKKSILLAVLCILLMLVFAACTGNGGSASGSASADAQETQAVSSTDTTQVTQPTSAPTAPKVVEAIAYKWDVAETSQQYRADAVKRIDEFTDLLLELNNFKQTHSKEKIEKFASSKDYIALSDNASGWARMINNYPADGVPADCTAIHSQLISLSTEFQSYMANFSEYVSSGTSASEDQQLNTIMDALVGIQNSIK